MKERLLLLGLVAILLTTGCNSVVHKKFSLDTTPATSLSVDARQRFCPSVAQTSSLIRD